VISQILLAIFPLILPSKKSESPKDTTTYNCEGHRTGKDSIWKCVLIRNSTGDTIFEHNLKNDKFDGLVAYYFDNKKPKSIDYYKEGRHIDTSFAWTSSGKIIFQSICDHIGANCRSTTFDSIGNIIAKSKRCNYLRCDTSIAWYSDRKTKEVIIYGSRGDTDRTIIRWNPAGFITDSMIFANRNEIEAFEYFGNGKLEDHRTWKVQGDSPRIWNIEKYDSTTRNLVGTVKDGNGLVFETTIGGSKVPTHYVDGIDQNELSDERFMALMSGKNVPAQRFDRYPDGSVRCMYLDLGGKVGLFYAVCYTPEGKKTSEVVKGNGTLIVPHSDDKGSEKRIFKKGKEVAH